MVVKEITAHTTNERKHQPTNQPLPDLYNIRRLLLAEKVVFLPLASGNHLSFSSLACLLIWHSLAGTAALLSTQPADAIFKMGREWGERKREEKKKKKAKQKKYFSAEWGKNKNLGLTREEQNVVSLLQFRFVSSAIVLLYPPTHNRLPTIADYLLRFADPKRILQLDGWMNEKWGAWGGRSNWEHKKGDIPPIFIRYLFSRGQTSTSFLFYFWNLLSFFIRGERPMDNTKIYRSDFKMISIILFSVRLLKSRGL